MKKNKLAVFLAVLFFATFIVITILHGKRDKQDSNGEGASLIEESGVGRLEQESQNNDTDSEPAGNPGIPDSYGVDILETVDGKNLMTGFPEYFEENMEWDNKSYGALSKRFLCVAASAESWLSNEYIFPNDIAKEYSYEEGGEKELIREIAARNNATCNEDVLSAKKIADIYGKRSFVIVPILKPSIFGTSGDYLIVKLVVENGTCAAFDPAIDNVFTCPVGYSHGFRMYSLAEILAAAGNEDSYYIVQEE